MPKIKTDERTLRKLKEFAKRGGEATKKKLGKSHYSKIGKLSASKKYKAYFSMMGKKSAEARRRKKEAASNPLHKLSNMLIGA
jgi:hypothetical protein